MIVWSGEVYRRYSNSLLRWHADHCSFYHIGSAIGYAYCLKEHVTCTFVLLEDHHRFFFFLKSSNLLRLVTSRPFETFTMSTLTSLSVSKYPKLYRLALHSANSYTYFLHQDKGSTRFAPKVKPRINRASNDPTKQPTEAAKATSSQKPAETGKEKEKEQFSSGRIAKLPVKVTKPQSKSIGFPLSLRDPS